MKKALDSQVQIRISPEMQNKSQKILKSYGMGNASFIRMAYMQLIRHGKLPFRKVRFSNGALTCLLEIRIDSKIKKQGNAILDQLEISQSDFVRMAYYHLIHSGKLPFKDISIY